MIKFETIKNAIIEFFKKDSLKINNPCLCIPLHFFLKKYLKEQKFLILKKKFKAKMFQTILCFVLL